ncbi:nucleosome assembly protein 1;4-like isoform X1 [Solanum lycopersicum]|uniref:nucleosome assembly protein 1;4-like isoform X1 n=1 Tax=Solanum lycopersicum TaxID=4081 RepID=UPI0008FEC972|nr:nucleosome assembly protein 1;4-like isoform X2 [Solanum lycopersicum]
MSTLDIYQSHLYPFTADAVASYAEYRAGLEIKQKDNLQKFSGSPSLKLKSLSPQVRKRVEALKNLQGQPAALKALLLEEKAVLKAGYEKLHESLHTKSERDTLQALFLKEKTVLEAKYEKLHESLHMKRYEIVNGVVEVKGDNMETGDVQRKVFQTSG